MQIAVCEHVGGGYVNMRHDMWVWIFFSWVYSLWLYILFIVYKSLSFKLKVKYEGFFIKYNNITSLQKQVHCVQLDR